MNVRHLSDSAILFRIESLTKRERDTTLLILLHLAEIERRKLHFKLGYQSLFDYCTSRLGYSASAAGRRIQTARCVARFPEVHGLLAAGQVNLSTIAQVSRLLTTDNREDLLSRIRGKSQREVEGIVAEYRPTANPRDRVRTVVVRVPARATDGLPTCAAISTPTSDHSRNGSDCENSAHPLQGQPATGALPAAATKYNDASSFTQTANVRQASGSASTATDPEAGTPHTPTETRVIFQFSARPAFARKLERVRSVLWHRLPANASLEQVFECALDELIAREDPTARHRRRERRRGVASMDNRNGSHNQRATSDQGAEHNRSETKGNAGMNQNKRTRHIPAAVRDRVFVRDKGQCTFVGSNGRRCGSTHALQVDHVIPFARGGTHASANLRLLCASHNRLEAERLMGPYLHTLLQG